MHLLIKMVLIFTMMFGSVQANAGGIIEEILALFGIKLQSDIADDLPSPERYPQYGITFTPSVVYSINQNHLNRDEIIRAFLELKNHHPNENRACHEIIRDYGIQGNPVTGEVTHVVKVH